MELNHAIYLGTKKVIQKIQTHKLCTVINVTSAQYSIKIFCGRNG